MYRGGLVAAVFILVGKGEEEGVDIIITALLRTLCQVAHPPANSLSRFVFLLLISIPVPLVLPSAPVQPPSFFQAESRRRRKGGRGVSTAIARIFMFYRPFLLGCVRGVVRVGTARAGRTGLRFRSAA